MSEQTEALVERLARDAAPVRRLRGPMHRAAIWLAVVCGLGAAVIFAFSDLHEIAIRAGHPELIVELAGTLGTGILATIAAFHLSLPDRSSRWVLLPLPALALWLAGSGAGCYRQWIVMGRDSWGLGESADCFLTILGFSVPLSGFLVIALRQARPLAPLRVAVTGGLGAAALAAFLLQFFHPFDVTLMDLAMHAIAVTIVVTIWGTGGSRLVG